MKILRIALSLTLVTVIAGALAACGGGEKKETAAQQPTGGQTAPGAQTNATGYKGGPAELVVVDKDTGVTDEQFQKAFVDPVRAKYPEITFKRSNMRLAEAIAAGTPPDIVLTSNPGLYSVLDLGVPEDLSSVIKTYNIDVNKMEPVVLNQMKVMGDQKYFYGIPFSMNYGVMIYNQDIFDKFGVAYPKVGINYNELLELAKKMTRKDSGVGYIGVLPPDLRQMYWQYGLPVFDQAKKKAVVTTEKHAQVFSLLSQFLTIPGYYEDGKAPTSATFFKEQRLAMYATWMDAEFSSDPGFRWDITAHPGFADRPGFGKGLDFHMLVVNKSSKNKEAAYQVAAVLLNEDVQRTFGKLGRLTVLKNDEIRKTFGTGTDVFKGKNLQSIFQVSPSPLPPSSNYDSPINSLLNKEAVPSVTINGIDINSALRAVEDKANKEIVIP
ncbi:ABC transporter substrate-binding protein [Paenibacillus ginsengarvi]|uniref:ABC transporter substrate-binding protein n=1 Tax=Paenibacillus ginsengarvi TaxID=400777 RepID=UPI001315935D|nr:extracellular solute-binding protein [Paenibacillus ginsengarvi]